MPEPNVHEAIEYEARRIARQEIASLCGLVLSRLDKLNKAEDKGDVQAALFSIFGEALRDFGDTPLEPGPAA